MHLKRTRILGFPCGPVVESLPCNAGDPGSVPGHGRCHVPQSSEASAPPPLSLRVTVTEAHLARDAAPQQEEPLQGETGAPQERGAPLLQAEKACVQQQRPTTAKKKKTFKKKSMYSAAAGYSVL